MLSLWGYFCFFGIKLKNFFLYCFVSILRFVFFPFKWCWDFFWTHTLSVFKRCWSNILFNINKVFFKVTFKKEKEDKINSMLEEIESTEKKHKSKNIFSKFLFLILQYSYFSYLFRQHNAFVILKK